MNDAQSPALKRPRDRVGRALDVLCRAFAVGGGLVLAAMALMMVFSIARRVSGPLPWAGPVAGPVAEGGRLVGLGSGSAGVISQPQRPG